MGTGRAKPCPGVCAVKCSLRISGRLLALLLALLCTLAVLPARGATPRWVGGYSWKNYGQIMNWYTPAVTYWVDPGPLSPTVNHASGVAIVDAAAAVWNIPTATLTLTNGGSLAEDVSGSNVYLGSNGPLWPADVSSSSYLTRPISVIFDEDGTITDMLLGSGASDPDNCLQAGVTDTEDLFVQPGNVAHAIVIINGRCTGPGTAPQLQLQYQLMRIFGRVLGLGWSQVNDNVFTGSTAPTYQQQMHWPIMHPIDIICGPYTYQCLPQPFMLRQDDIASLERVYASQGVWTQITGSGTITATLTFPTGQGMNGANIATTILVPQNMVGVEGWQSTSAVSGEFFAASAGNPVTGPAANANPLDIHGIAFLPKAGYFELFGVPIYNVNWWETVFFTAEPINALYTGQYAIGPYTASPVSPSGTFTGKQGQLHSRAVAQFPATPATGAASTCSTPLDGTEKAPAPMPATGEWTSQFCSYGHSGWFQLPAEMGHSATVEITATDGNGVASTSKALPLIGAWHGSDATGTLPTMAAATAPFNGAQNGTTTLPISFSTTENVRLGFAEARTEGRPDFLYHARILYATSVQPASLPASGGAIRVFGMGFEPGNSVTVGGVPATVTSVTPNEIDAVVHSLPAAVNDVTISDLRTLGTTTISGGISYAASGGALLYLVQAPPATANVGTPVSFQVKLTDQAGSPIANGAVTFSSTAGSVLYLACGQPACTVFTNTSGVATGLVAAQAAGTITLVASSISGSTVASSFTALAALQTVAAVRSTEYVAAGPGAAFSPEVLLKSNGIAAIDQPVLWASPSADVQVLAASTLTAADGSTSTRAAAALFGGEQVQLQACGWISTCTLLPIVGVSQADLGVIAVSGAAQVVPSAQSLGTVVLRVMDRAGHGVAGATVTIHQAVQEWEPPCPALGRCPAPVVYATRTTTASSDDDGLLTVTPLQYTSLAQVTEVTACVGSSAALTLTLQKTP